MDGTAEGIFNYRGQNTPALSLWAYQGGAKLDGFKLEATGKHEMGRPPMTSAPAASWKARPGAY